jgi:hypothetical protein
LKALEPIPVNLFVAYLSVDPGLMAEATRRLEAFAGPMERESGLWDFSATDYYSGEMGGKLKRKVVSFKELMDPGRLAGLKLFSNMIERENSDERGQRLINIDPGYVALEKVVLASCKNFSHRIYMGLGVYGDLTLTRKGNEYVPLEWTYPEYKDGEMKNFLEEVRRDYATRLELKGRRSTEGS